MYRVTADGSPYPVLGTYFKVPTNSCCEGGVTGLAFHPNFMQNGLMYIVSNKISFFVEKLPELYSNCTNTYFSRIQSFRPTKVSNKNQQKFPQVVSNALGNPSPNRIFQTISQNGLVHNAGHIMFGPDGYLYFTSGDGANFNTAQVNSFHNCFFANRIIGSDLLERKNSSNRCRHYPSKST
jgi:hypothetical protein